MCADERLAVGLIAVAAVLAVVLAVVGAAAGWMAYGRIVARARRIEAAALATLAAMTLVVQGADPAPRQRAKAK